MSLSRKPKPEQSQSLIDFLKQELERRNISLRAAAKEIGISGSHLSHIMTGRKTPDAGVCNEIAAYFGVPRLEIYRMAGWLDVQDDPDDLVALRNIAESNDQWLEWKRVYESIGDSDEKKVRPNFDRA